MAGSIDVDLEDFMSSEFVTFRKTKNYSETQYSTKYNVLNFVNKHFVRQNDNLLKQVRTDTIDCDNSLIKSKYQRRYIRLDLASSSALIMNTSHSKSWKMLKVIIKHVINLIEYYQNSINDLPKRHFHNKFIKDYK